MSMGMAEPVELVVGPAHQTTSRTGPLRGFDAMTIPGDVVVDGST